MVSDSEFRRICMEGDINIVKFVIRDIESRYGYRMHHWNQGLRGACKGGHLDIIELMIELGANDWNGGLKYSCENGHLDIVKLMIQHGANDWYRVFNSIFNLIDPDIVDLIVARRVHLEYHLKYPKDQTTIFRLCESGLLVGNLKNIDGFNDLLRDIDERRDAVKHFLFDHLIDDLIEVVNQYVVN